MNLDEYEFEMILRHKGKEVNTSVTSFLSKRNKFFDEDGFKNMMIQRIISPGLTTIYSKLEPEVLKGSELMCAGCKNLFLKEHIQLTKTLKLTLCKNCMEVLSAE